MRSHGMSPSIRERGAERPPKVMAATVRPAFCGEGKMNTSARSAAGSASAPGDSAWSADITETLVASTAAIASARGMPRREGIAFIVSSPVVVGIRRHACFERRADHSPRAEPMSSTYS